MGLTVNSSVVKLFHTNIHHNLLSPPIKSSMLPATTTDGTAEAKPEKERPMNRPEI